MPKKTFSEEMERRFMEVCSISCEFVMKLQMTNNEIKFPTHAQIKMMQAVSWSSLMFASGVV